MGANTQGRIIAARSRVARAMAAQAKAGKESAHADLEYIREKDRYETHLRHLHDELKRMYDAEARIRAQFATVENIAAAKNVVFDSTSALSRFFGYFKNPVVSFVAGGVGAAAEGLRGPTSSDLLGIIPGSSNSVPGLDIAGGAQTAADLTEGLASVLKVEGGALTNLGHFNALTSAYQHGYDAGQLLQGNNIFAATPLPRIGNIFNLTDADLDKIANQLRENFDPGVIERLRGLDNERLARDVETYRDARTKAGEYGNAVRGRQEELREAEQKNKLAEEKKKEAKEDFDEAFAAYLASLDEKGVSVKKK